MSLRTDKNSSDMKNKILLPLLACLASVSLSLAAEDNAPAPVEFPVGQPAPAAPVEPVASPAPASESSPAAKGTKEAGPAAPAPETSAPAPAVENPAPSPTLGSALPVAAREPQASTNGVPEDPSTAAAPGAGAGGAPPAGSPGASPNDVVPLIVIDDVPLTDAIRNLARQSGLNFQFDPRITTMGADGKPTNSVSISIRFENVTAQEALNAVLDNYGLILMQDQKSRIARVTI